MVHRINTCFGVSTPLFGLQKWMTGSIFNVHSTFCEEFFYTVTKFLQQEAVFDVPICFTLFFASDLYAKILSAPEVFQHRANTVPTPVWPRCWHVPTPVWGQVLAHLTGRARSKVWFYVGTASRLSILSTCLQTFRPCCPACGTVRVEDRSQKLERRVKISLRK